MPKIPDNRPVKAPFKALLHGLQLPLRPYQRHPLFSWLVAVVLVVVGLLSLPFLAANADAAATQGVPAAESHTIDVPIVQSMAWWMDRRGDADLATVQQATDWTPFRGWKSWSFGPEPVWVRLRLRAGDADSLLPWVAHIRPSYLDHLTLYDPAAGLVWHGGDAEAIDDEGMGAVTFTFSVPQMGQPRDLYLRIESTSARAVNADVLTLNVAKRQVRLQEWLYGFATTMSFIFALWAATQWWQSRERVIGIFVVKQLFAATWAFLTLGFARVLFDGVAAPGVISAINNTVLAGVIASVMWFMKNLLAVYRPRRTCVGIMSLLGVLAPATLLLQLVGWHWQSVMLLNLYITVLLVLLVAVMATAKGAVTKPPIPRRWMTAYIGLYVVLNALPMLTLLGVLGSDSELNIGFLAYLLMDGMVMAVLLQVRANAMRQHQQEVEQALAVAKEKAHLEQLHRKEQGGLLAMLAHEVKTPLATMRMWMDAGPLNREAMERAISDMNRVIERCVHAGQLSDQGLQPSPQRVNARQLAQDVVLGCREPARVYLHTPPEDVFLETDPQMLSIVLANLLDNACKYGASADSGSRITLNLYAASNAAGAAGWCWDVCNAQGPAGTPDADKLFSKYYRGKQARRQSGSGLGLYLVKSLLELLQGDITYEPRAGEVVFRVWLPG
ncbi:ATP-binding protein [Aquabacterium sp.]|uniref:sensor histidine kinase n=1 Tax=Aquabacterium sp. TaxID=1872578 RepID=UPI003CFFF592